MRDLLLVTNADAGTNDDETLQSALDVLERGTSVDVRRTRDEADLDAALASVADRALVLAGGDGTIHLVLSRLHARDELAGRVLGLVPLGTGNDLARGVGIPLDPQAAAEVILAGRPRDMDLLVDDEGSIVANAVHIGVGADAARAAEPWKRRLGKAGYVVGAVIAGLRAQGLHLEVETDGERLTVGRRRVLMVGIGNGATIGGGTALAPRADPGDGRADVVISHAVGRLERLRYGVRLRRGTHEERHDVRSTRAGEVRVRGEPFWCNADGEVAGPFRSRTWRVRPSAYRLLVPREAARD